MKNLRKLTILILVLLSTISVGYSQKTVLSNTCDTLVCFTQPQTKFLLKEHYQKELSDSLLSICESQTDLYKVIVQSKDKIIDNQQSIIANDKQIIENQEAQKAELNANNKSLKKQLRKSRFKTFLVGAVGLVSTTIVTILYVQK